MELRNYGDTLHLTNWLWPVVLPGEKITRAFQCSLVRLMA